jgi:hypothetical protein
VIKLTDTQGNPLLVHPQYVMAVLTFHGDTREFKHTPRSTILIMGGVSVAVCETVDDYQDTERLGLGEVIG